jgi:hypothetical protein
MFGAHDPVLTPFISHKKIPPPSTILLEAINHDRHQAQVPIWGIYPIDIFPGTAFGMASKINRQKTNPAALLRVEVTSLLQSFW